MTKKADLMSLQVFALSVSSYTFLLRTKNMIIQKNMYEQENNISSSVSSGLQYICVKVDEWPTQHIKNKSVLYNLQKIQVFFLIENDKQVLVSNYPLLGEQ